MANGMIQKYADMFNLQVATEALLNKAITVNRKVN